MNKKKFSILRGSQRICLEEDGFEHEANDISSVTSKTQRISCRIPNTYLCMIHRSKEIELMRIWNFIINRIEI